LTKYILIILLLAVVGWLVYRRLRPYIRAARRILTTMRDVRATISEQETLRTAARPRAAQTEKLEQCAACGVWLPASRVIHSSSDRIYCSSECFEQQTVKGDHIRRATANKR
jgi:type II secretory pathway component PulM